MIPLFYPQIYKKEWLKELGKIFDTQWLGQGPKVDEFEKAFGEKFGYQYCLGVNSGSAALELAYHLIGLKERDEVITTVFTCTATNIPLLRRKVKIVFADINNQMTIDYDDVKRKITKKTKAVVAVTLGGLPIDKRLFDLGVPIVVDAAQSVGVRESKGDYICYSFQAIKHFTTGDGGMLVLGKEEDYKRAKKLRWFGIDREAKRRVGFNCITNREMNMEIEEAGYKFHMNDISATLGLTGLKHTDEILKYRKLLCDTYARNLPKTMKPIFGGSYWLMAVLSEDRDDIVEYLRANGVGCDLVQLRNDIFKVFGGRKQNLPNMNRLEKEYFYLPLNAKITVKDVRDICKLLCDR